MFLTGGYHGTSDPRCQTRRRKTTGSKTTGSKAQSQNSYDPAKGAAGVFVDQPLRERGASQGYGYSSREGALARSAVVGYVVSNPIFLTPFPIFSKEVEAHGKIS